MKLLNHISIVTRDLSLIRQFLQDILGYEQHNDVESWFVSNDGGPTIHVIEIEDAEVPSDEDMHHYYRHFAIEIHSLSDILAKALELNLVIFQMDFDGNEHEVVNSSDDLAFGIKTLFIRDNDGNLWEFLQRGHSFMGFWSA